MSNATESQKRELTRRLELPTDHPEHISSEQLTRAFGVWVTSTQQRGCQGKARRGPPIVRIPTAAIVTLSKREAEVLSLLALGKQKEDIARELTVSLGTIKTHCEKLRKKLGATTMAQAVAVGIHLGFIVIESE